MKHTLRLSVAAAALMLTALPLQPAYSLGEKTLAQATPPPAVPPATNAPAASAPAATATRSQPLSVAAGTGVLLRLPQPMATVMSADPGIARAQPASPDSLFLMGVAPGHTTVIATNTAGAAIVQYDVTV